MFRRRILILLILTLFAFNTAAQERTTTVQGTVIDAISGEALPFVQVGFVGTTIGTTTDMDGRFRVTRTATEGYDTMRFQMMGYEAVTQIIARGTTKRNLKVTMKPRSTVMQEVVITASRKDRKRYRRRDNPAVELARNVIEHKEMNRLQSLERYNREVYEKTTMALDDFHPDFEGKRIWRKLNFLEKYIDLTPFDATPILTISMREQMMQQSYRQKPRQNRTLLTAKRMEGLDEILGQEGIDASLSEMFVPIDIYDNDIELMLNHFTSPLSSTLAITFYKFYITDTVEIDGQPCVELSFVPANDRSYGFTGQMYIALDSSYAVTRYSMTVSPHVNLNFVRDLTVIQSYTPTTSPFSGKTIRLPDRCDTYGRMFIHKKLQEVYVHQVRINHKYNISDTATLLHDSLFSPLSNTASLPKTKMRRKVWNELRPIELTMKETVIDSLRYELARLPEMQRLRKAAEITFTGYISTSAKRDSSRFDIGPIYNFVSHNHYEGWRIRLGGMTTAKLSPRNFAEGYIAYGFSDKRLKFNTSLIHTFDDKERHSHESPQSRISLTAGYELEAPGQNFDNFDRDNIMMSSDVEQKLQYVAQGVLRLQKQWPSHLRIDTWLAARRYEPTGLLQYEQYLADGTLRTIDHFAEAEWMGKVTFSPNRDPDSRRPGTANITNLKKDAPTINLTHRIGLIEGGFRYQRTDFSAEKRFWLSAFGHIDAKLLSGIVWNRVPYPRLCFPSGNDNIFLSSSAFNTMRPMEFIVDQYASFFATYHLKGWILNKIPLIKRLRLREVAGFNILYGGLSAKNNPIGENATGLFKLPDGTKPLGEKPYMEYSIGIENILGFIRIDYIRRISYDEGMSSKEKGFIKIEFRFTI
ncbi:MAG: carboxypeptidase-like regulatory domain-containing protein [Bacteroidales bacterium]|nr:carboxypeptidase-like regulatory domain-containing protein [Bacteroidales bacterium]